MTRNSDIDAWTVAYHIGLLNNTDSYRKSSDHMFHYTLKNPAAAVRVEAIDRFGNKYEQTVFTDPAEPRHFWQEGDVLPAMTTDGESSNWPARN